VIKRLTLGSMSFLFILLLMKRERNKIKRGYPK